MDMHTLGMFVGAVVGLACGLGLVALLFKKKVLDTTFDERQELARGQAYKYGFYAMLISVIAYGYSDILLGRWCDVLTGVMLCVCISMTVFAVVCIRRDAYLSLRERPRQVMLLFGALALINLAIGGVYMAEGSLVQDGVLTFRAVNPIAGGLLLVILAVYAADLRLRGREDETE